MSDKNFAALAVALSSFVTPFASAADIAGTPVTPGALCTFTDTYFASTSSVVAATFTDGAGNNSFVLLGSLNATNGANVLFTPSPFTAPAGAVTVFVEHGAVGNGTVIISNSQLTCTNAGSGSGSGGSGQVIFPSATNPAAANTLATPYSVVWQNIIPENNNGGTFTFSDTYSDVGPSTIIITFTAVSGVGGQLRSLLSPTLAAGTNLQASVSFQLPQLVPGTTISVIHNTDNNNDAIVATNPVLTESN